MERGHRLAIQKTTVQKYAARDEEQVVDGGQEVDLTRFHAEDIGEFQN